MADQAGSIERLALAFGDALRQIAGLLEPNRALETLAEFGVAFPPQLLEHPGFAAARAATVQAAEALDSAVEQLASAIEAEDLAQAVPASVLVVDKAGELIDSFDDLATQLQAAGAAMPGVAAAQIAALTDQLPERLLDFLIVRKLDAIPPLGAALTLFGLIERTHHPALPGNPTSVAYEVARLHLDRLGAALTTPTKLFEDVYGWGGPVFDGQRLLPALSDVAALLGLPARFVPAAGGQPAHAEAGGVDFKLAPGSPPGLSIDFLLALGGVIDRDLPAPAPGWQAHLKATTSVAAGTSGAARPPLAIELHPPSGELKGEAEVTLTRHPAEPFLLLGAVGGSGLEAGELDVGVGLAIDWDGGKANVEPRLSAQLKAGKLVVDTGQADGFLTSILGGQGVEAEFEVGAAWGVSTGVRFMGSSALDIELPVHQQLGPLEVPSVYLVLGLGSTFTLELSADLKASLGPLVATVHRLGARANLSFPPGGGNAGPAQLGFTFKAPTGMGLSVNAGPITGGGTLDFDPAKGEYFGALELSFQGLFSLKAVAILSTRMPDGSEGFSLLILVTAEFMPIQLGFGFTLIGVGGLLGLNRSLNSEALRQGVRTGSLDSVLFPPDVVGNIGQIVSDLKSFFPIAEGHFVVAPMGKLGWGTPTLISLELGVIIDIPSPQLTIIGVLRCILPEEDAPILRLQVAFAGGIDFDKGLIWFDASLFDSGLLTFTLSGDMALRIGWGEEPMLVISVGGFHPAFHEVPPDLTGMKRLTIALLSGENPRLVAQSYFAVTSNTVQSGSRVELYAAACGFNVYGFLGYDLLIQFDPFHFIANIAAGLALRQGTDVIVGISVSCELSGPTPWHAKGSASFEILFLSIEIGFDVTWGDDSPSLPAATEDVMALLVAAAKEDDNWRTELPANTSQTVTLRDAKAPAGSLLAHPFGVLSVSQKVVPLDFEINRFGNKKPKGETKFAMTWAGDQPEEMREEFAVANFVTLSDSEKLSRKSFEGMKSGLRFATGDASSTGTTVHKDVNYEFSYLRRHRAMLFLVGLLALPKPLFDRMVGGSAIAENEFSVARRRAGGNGPAAVETPAAQFHVVKVSDLTLAAATASVATQAEAWALHDELIGANPALAGTLQVVADHELAVA